jgi:hypothetical protein
VLDATEVVAVESAFAVPLVDQATGVGTKEVLATFLGPVPPPGERVLREHPGETS